MVRALAAAVLFTALLIPLSGSFAEESTAVDLQNTVCPFSGHPVRPGVTATADGMIIHVCCEAHAAEVRANPAAYEGALRKDPAVAKRMDAVAKQIDAAGARDAAQSADGITAKGAEFHDVMRKLWEDHVTWTRMVVISALADAPDKDAATQRLLKNQEDIGNAIKPYYGDAAGTKLTTLLKEHITTAADLIGALKADDSSKADAAKQKWLANADGIAAFLSKANPSNWPLDAVKKMLREHLDLTTKQVTARLDQDWAADVAAYDRIHDQALRMADMLCEGIQRQFPAKFLTKSPAPESPN